MFMANALETFMWTVLLQEGAIAIYKIFHRFSGHSGFLVAFEREGGKNMFSVLRYRMWTLITGVEKLFTKSKT